MKKISILSILSIVLLASCVTGTDVEAKNEDGSPIWTTTVPVSNRLYYGVGAAKLANEHNSYDAADSKARADLAKKLESTIKEAGTVYTNDTEGQVLSAYEKITMEVVNLTMRGVLLEQHWMAPDGTAWSLVSFPIKNVPKNMELEANSYVAKVTEQVLALEAKHKSQLLEIEKAEAMIRAAIAAKEAAEAMTEAEKAEAEKVEPDPQAQEDLRKALDLINGLMQASGADTPEGLRDVLEARFAKESAKVRSQSDGIDAEAIGKAVADELRALGYEVE